MTKTLFLIPARGGSKGIPGKNIKELGGRPLIAYAIGNAQALAQEGDEICISTDSEAIRDVAEKAGVKVPFLRPAELASDTAGTYEVILHALDYYKERGKEFDRVVLLQATSPFCTAKDVAGAMALWTPEVDMVVSVAEASTNPYYNAYETDAEGFLEISKGPGNYKRRQDAPKVWEYNGAVYVMTESSLRRGPLGSFRRRVPYEMEKWRSVDLDTPLDWMVAEAIMESLKKKK